MRSIEEIQAELVSLDNPALKNESTVCEMWEDGEITYTKGGELYGLRGLHMIYPGFTGLSMDLPHKHNNGHSQVFIPPEDAKRLWDEIRKVQHAKV